MNTAFNTDCSSDTLDTTLPAHSSDDIDERDNDDDDDDDEDEEDDDNNAEDMEEEEEETGGEGGGMARTFLRGWARKMELPRVTRKMVRSNSGSLSTETTPATTAC